MIFSDVDGVMTDGGLYYSAEGESLKRFNVKDGMIAARLRDAGFKLGVLTGRYSRHVETRFKELNYDFIVQGSEDKLADLRKIIDDTQLRLENVAYIGDDINDKGLLGAVGFSACPADAVTEIRQSVDYVTTRKGGHGAYREFADYILQEHKNR